ncbi:MAG: hypothetical protein H3C49_03580 [Alphaproteobacteria bacterium]|nr:hypothetical protein [Alphaproteobacteria bacterium]
MSKFLSNYGQGEERAAKAEAGFRSYYQELLDNRGPEKPNPNAGYVNAASPLAAKIATALHQAGARNDGNTSITETANVIAKTIGDKKSFSEKAQFIQMMIGPHLKDAGSFMPADPQKVQAAVGSVLNVVSPPPSKPKAPGGP